MRIPEETSCRTHHRQYHSYCNKIGRRFETLPMNNCFYMFSQFVQKLIEQRKSYNQSTKCEYATHHAGCEKTKTCRGRNNNCDERCPIHGDQPMLQSQLPWKYPDRIRRAPRDALLWPSSRNHLHRQARDDLVMRSSNSTDPADSRCQIVQLPSMPCMRFASSGCSHYLRAQQFHRH